MFDLLIASFLDAAVSDRLLQQLVDKWPKVDHKVQEADSDQKISHHCASFWTLDEVTQDQH